MKNFYQRLCDMPMEALDKLITAQQGEIAILQRDLELMQEARAVRAEQQAMADIERGLMLRNKLASLNAQQCEEVMLSIEAEEEAKNAEFPQLLPDAPQVPEGLRPRQGVVYGCGGDNCKVCYVDKEDEPVPFCK